MSGFPASVFTAIPVDSGSSDYYGSCVALPAGCGFRQSPVAYIKHELSAFSVKGFSHVTFAISLYLEALHPEYHTLVLVHMTSARMTCVSASFTRRRRIFPSSGCQSSSLAFILIREFSSLYKAVLETYYLRYIRCDYSDTMLHSPLGFPFRIRCGMTGYFFTCLSLIPFFPPLAQGGI